MNVYRVLDGNSAKHIEQRQRLEYERASVQ